MKNQRTNAVQGKTDAVEARAAEIAQREQRDAVTDEDRKRAYKELNEMGAAAAKPTP